MIDQAYQYGVKLAEAEFEKEALGGLLSGISRALAPAAKGLLGAGARKGFKATLAKQDTLGGAFKAWQKGTGLGNMTRPLGWMAGFGRGGMTVGMPLGMGVMGAATADPGQRGSAFLKGVGGGIAFNAGMKGFGALGRAAGGRMGKSMFKAPKTYNQTVFKDQTKMLAKHQKDLGAKGLSEKSKAGLQKQIQGITSNSGFKAHSRRKSLGGGVGMVAGLGGGLGASMAFDSAFDVMSGPHMGPNAFNPMNHTR
jgi:hypothetical protein